MSFAAKSEGFDEDTGLFRKSREIGVGVRGFGAFMGE
jgi:hypothetical protein